MAQAAKPGFFWSKTVEIYKQSFVVLSETPTVLFLFIFMAVLDYLALAVLFFAHSEPVSLVLAPIIRTFWGSRFLHYPDNFLLLPKLLNHAHFVLTCVVGVILTGIAIKLIESSLKGDRRTVVAVSGVVFKKYFALLTAWVFSYGVFYYGLRFVLRSLPSHWFIQVGTSYLLGIVVQGFLIFLFPALLIAGRGLLKDSVTAFRFSFRHFGEAVAILAVPMLAVMFISFLRALAPVFIRFSPELVLGVLIFNIPVSMVVDLLLTTAATILFYRSERGLSNT